MIDLHNDLLTAKLAQNAYIKYLFDNKKYLERLFCPIFTTQLNNPIQYIVDSNNLLKQYQFAEICIEDIGFLPQDNFDFLLQIKPKYVGLVWNNSNVYGGGAYDYGGLTKAGKKLVKFLEQNSIIVDTAHMNMRTFFDFVNITEKPIFCSHTGFYSMVNDRRNLTNEQIKIIVQSGGIVGLFFVGKYLSKNSEFSSANIVKNIDYFVQNFGIKNLAIGTDFFGTNDLPCDICNYLQINKIRQELLKIGYKTGEIDAIFTQNAKNINFW